MKEIRYKWTMLLALALVGAFLDWYTKYLADTYLNYGIPVPVIGDYIQLFLVYNKGALFGIDPRSWFSDFPTNQFFFVFNIIAMILLVLYYGSVPKSNRLMHWGIALILPGAIGNLLDRVFHAQKGVVDFIKIGVSQDIYWPIFNLADIYVTVGIIILIFCFISDERQRKTVAGQKTMHKSDEIKSELSDGKPDA